MMSSVARDMGWSDDAIKVFDKSPYNPPLRGDRHDSVDGITHMGDYKKDLEAWAPRAADRLGIDPKSATTEQAERFMKELRYNGPPRVMQFNKSLWIQRVLKNEWWFRPTE